MLRVTSIPAPGKQMLPSKGDSILGDWPWSSQEQASERSGIFETGTRFAGTRFAKAICAGFFVTIFLPARHSCAAELPRAQGLKTILRNAVQEPQSRRFQGLGDQLLKPLEGRGFGRGRSAKWVHARIEL